MTMLQPKLLKIEPLDSYKIKLEYETGEVKIFDVTPYILGNWYEELNDQDYFKTVRITSSKTSIEWANGQDIAPHELYEMSISAGDNDILKSSPADSLKTSLKEMQLKRQGKLKKRSWNDLKKELNKNID